MDGLRFTTNTNHDNLSSRPIDFNPFAKMKNSQQTTQILKADLRGDKLGLFGSSPFRPDSKAPLYPGLSIFSVPKPMTNQGKRTEMPSNLSASCEPRYTRIGPEVRLTSHSGVKFPDKIKTEPLKATKPLLVQSPGQQTQSTNTVQKYRYYLGEGNNFEIIARVLKTRDWWQRVSSSTDNVHLFMTQVTRHCEFERFSSKDCPIGPSARCLNRFEGYRQLTEKDLFFINLFKYCEKNRLNVYDYVPLTYILDFEDPNFEKKLQHFMRVHRAISWFNELLSQGRITAGPGDQYNISKVEFDTLSGKQPKPAEKPRARKAKNEEGHPRNTSGDVEEAAPHRRVRTKKITAFSLVSLTKLPRDGLDLSFLPVSRKEYQDPTAKFKYSIPHLEEVFNKGHNIW